LGTIIEFVSRVREVRNFTILISDRNKNVREYLRRELETEGYHVQLAISCQDVLRKIYQNEFIDLIIIDPDLFKEDEAGLFEKIGNRVPALPVILHTFSSDYHDKSNALHGVYFVEKNGNSIENLKKVVSELLF
jgi:DNA-binding NtrC family response regulator